MWIFISITIRMMHSVHDRIRAGIQEGRTLSQKRYEVKCFLPKRRHRKHFVRCISMKEKGLAEQRQKPVREEENQYDH